MLALETDEVEAVELYRLKAARRGFAHLGVAVVRVIGQLNVRHIGKPHIADAVNAAQDHTFQLIHIVKRIADF